MRLSSCVLAQNSTLLPWINFREHLSDSIDAGYMFELNIITFNYSFIG